MKILIIGTGYSQFVKEPIEFTMVNSYNKIYVTYDKERSDLYKDYYEKNNVTLINTHDKSTIVGRIPKLGVLYNLFLEVRKYAKEGIFDVIHIHSVSSYWLTWFIVNFLSKYTKRIICTFYGSDLFLRSDSELKKFDKLLSKMDNFSMSTDNLIYRFKKAFGNKYDDKIRKIPFGLANLIAIDEADCSIICKTNLEVDPDKLLISIGHNTCEEQQHLLVIDELSKLSRNELERISIVLQLTYGSGSKEYVDKVITAAKKTGCEVIVLEQYMDREAVAVLAKATDVYINSQVSDAISGAMLEYLYANTIVLNPGWIDYSELEKNGCDFITYNEFEQLPDYIRRILDGELVVDKNRNHDIIHSLSHWDSHKDKWISFLSIQNKESNYAI